MFKDFNRQGHRQLSAEISAELTALAARHGLTISAGGGSIGTSELVIKLAITASDTKAIEQQARNELCYTGRGLGLGPDDYGMIFTSGRDRYRFVSCNPNRPKYPISGERVSDGRSFKFPAYVARDIIAARKPATNIATPAPQAPSHSSTMGIGSGGSFAAPAGLPQF